MALLTIDLAQLRSKMAVGQLSRHDALEEIEHHLAREPDEPLPGLLELLLELLHETPADPHLLRLLAQVYERDGDREGARHAVETAQRAGRTSSTDSAAYDLSGDTTSVRDHLVVGRVLLEAGFVDEAADVTTKALSAEPNSLAAVNLLAKIRHVQGRLTDTIRLWIQLQAMAPNKEGALAHLGILHRISRDDDAGGAFMAVGDEVYARKYEGQVELERAFARFGDRDFAGAIAQCESLASKTREGAIYKLAILQKAWIQDRTGDVEGAHATLHALGRERGFETDLDRLGFLAKLCERIGTPASLHQAVHIYEHLSARHGKLTALPRLAQLNAALGELELAARYTAEYERRFARRMQKPSPAETLRAIAMHYVPLDRVVIEKASDEDRDDMFLELRLAHTLAGRRRRRALLAYLDGDRARAERILTRLCRTRLATFRDFAYLADLYAMRGDAAACAFYAEALRRGGATHVPLWDRFFDATKELARPQARRMLLPDDVDFAHRTLLGAARAHRADPRRWYHLAAFERMRGDVEAAEKREEKARELARVVSDGARPGRVLAAAVYNLAGKRKGLVHEIVAGRRAAKKERGGAISERDILGFVTPDFVALTRRVLEVAKDYARAHWPHLAEDADGYVYRLKVAKDDEPSSGSSAGLPIAIAFLSLILRKPVPLDLAFTGAVTCDAQSHVTVQPVGDALYKVKGAYHCNLRGILVPRENREDVERDGRVPVSISQKIARYVSRLDEAVEIVWGAEAWEW